jgi:hypothetical protein
VFIERPKASLWKAAALVLAFTVFNNLVQRLSIELPAPSEWAIYIAFAAMVVWALFKLKPINNLTVGVCYVVGRWALVYFASLLPLEMLNA